MGVEESKLAGSQRYFDHFLCPHSRVNGRPWTLVQTCTLRAWRRKYGNIFNFADSIVECPYSKPTECTNSFCLTKQNIVNLSKRRGNFSFHKHSKYSKLAEHFEYNHIPAHLSSVQNLHFKSILCTRNGLAIVHLARNLVTQFGIVDLHIHKFLGTFGRQSVRYSPDSVAAQISPDSSICLIRLPWSRTSRVTTLQLYNLRTRELITELPLTTDIVRQTPLGTPNSSYRTGSSSNRSSFRSSFDGRFSTTTSEPVRAFGGYNQPSAILFDFDPRFENSRIVLANVHFVQHRQADRGMGYSPLYHRRFPLAEEFFEAQAPCLTLVRLPSWQRIAKTRNFGELPDSILQDQRIDRRLNNRLNILKVFYSRAGHLIFAVVTTTSSCRCGSLAQALHFSNIFTGSNESSRTNSPDLSQQRRWYCADEGSTSSQNPLPIPGCTPMFLTVFHGDSLDTLRVIRFDRPLCPTHTCPTNYLPVMSKCGSRLALIALATVSTGTKRGYKSGRRGYSDAEGSAATPRRRRVNTLNISSSVAMTTTATGFYQDRPGSSHINANWMEGEQDPSLWTDDDFQALPRTTPHDTGLSSPIGRKLHEMVFVYQLEPPPTLQAIVRQKVRQVFDDDMLDKLGLPPGLVAYLRFQPSFSCSGSCLSRSESMSTTSALLTPLRSNSLEL